MSGTHRTDRQLPEGVAPGVWEYTQSDQVAARYDKYFAQNKLFEFDEQVLARHLTRPGLVADLGCGTGRALVPLARRGFAGLAVDLSMRMLQIVGEKAALEDLPIYRLRANLVRLDCLRDESVDYGLCLFSTLGMIRGRAQRVKMLRHARRILKPGGVFVLHVHNLWFNLFRAGGRRWLARHVWETTLHRDVEWGDKFFDYRGVPKMFLHTFRRRELRADLVEAGFRMGEQIPLAAGRHGRLRWPWFFGGLRANGWIVVCHR